jgi:hypothetical protein
VIGRLLRSIRTPLTLLVLLGILCYGAWWGYSNVLQEPPPPPPTPCIEQTVPKGVLRSSQVTVSVYNGGTRRGLAGDVGRRLRDRGFRVVRWANTAERVQETVIVGAGAKNPEVLLVKRFFKDATVRTDNRPDRSVDVLVGNRYGGFNKKAKTTLAVSTQTVCLPPQASPSPTGLGG